MKIVISFLIVFFSLSVFAKPKVLECKKNCGASDTEADFTFQARLSMGSEKWGGNITFIEDDIAISQADVIGLNPEKKICCTPKEIKKAAEDWKNFKNDMYCLLYTSPSPRDS